MAGLFSSAGGGRWEEEEGALTAILERGGTGTQPSGGSSVPKTSAVPATSRTRTGASGGTSTRSSLCGASLYCRGGCAAPRRPWGVGGFSTGGGGGGARLIGERSDGRREERGEAEAVLDIIDEKRRK